MMRLFKKKTLCKQKYSIFATCYKDTHFFHPLKRLSFKKVIFKILFKALILRCEELKFQSIFYEELPYRTKTLNPLLRLSFIQKNKDFYLECEDERYWKRLK